MTKNSVKIQNTILGLLLVVVVVVFEFGLV